MTLSIGGVGIGGNNPCRFVAEISNNHNGSPDRAHALIDAAKRAGADFVKFQCYTPDELVELRGDAAAPEPWGSQGWTMRSLYEKARTPTGWFQELFAHAREIDLVPFSSVFGLESLVALEHCACPAYKIARLDNGQFSLIRAVASRNKPVLISGNGPMRNLDYPEGPCVTAHRLWCPPGYPTAPTDVRLPAFYEHFYKESECYIGLSSHCLDPRLPIAAVARGCKVIEMHFMLADEPSELEANVSLTQHQFAQMVADVRATEAMLA